MIMSILHRTLTLSSIGLLSFLLTGCSSCDDRAIQMGEHGNLRFYYEPADLVTKFNRPIATGSELTLYVQDSNKNAVQKILNVQSEQPDILSATPNSRAHNAILLNGQREGTTKISVQAQTARANLEDRIAFDVLDTREISLQHACTSGANAAYLVRAPAQLNLTRKSQGRVLVGQSRSCDILVEPADIQPSTHCDEAHFHLPAFDSFGSVRLTAQRNNARGGKDQLGVQIVDRQIIDFLPLEEILREDRTTEITLFAETMTEPYWPVCHNFVMDVVIETPRICLGANGSDERAFTVSSADNNTFSLKGLRRGECFFSIIFPEINPDEIWEFSLPVER